MFNKFYLMSKKEQEEHFRQLQEASIPFFGELKKIDLKNKVNGEKVKKGILQTVYGKKPEYLADETLGVFQMIRYTAMLAVFAFQPIAAIAMYIADRVIEEKVNEKSIDSMLSKYKSELELVEKKIDDTEDDRAIENLKSYKKTLEDSIYNMEQYKETLDDYKKEKPKEDSKSDDDDFVFEAIIAQINRGIEEYELLTEANAVKKAVDKATYVTRKTEDHIDNSVDNVVLGMKKAVMSENRDQLIRGTLPKASKILRNAIIGGAGLAINAPVTIVAGLVALALHKKVKAQEKTRILHELRDALELTEEKIKDADSQGDREEKYRLIKIRNELRRDIDKIRYNIDSLNVSSGGND